MQLSLNDIEWLVGSEQTLTASAVVPFDETVIEELETLSKALLKDPASRPYPDVVTFGFFCRRANLMKLKETSQLSTFNLQLRLGRGLIFHIAPSNVPVNFAYSVVAGLLAGNTNVVRVSQKSFPQVDIIVKHMLATEMHRVAVVRYPHESNANEVFSALCDVRVIWGGDATIANIRRNALKPRAFDVCFADRYSVAAINAEAIDGNAPMDKLAEAFYNDTYLFDQNACSAPHLILWTGSEAAIEQGKQLFWEAVYAVAKKRYTFQEVMAVDKLTALYKQAAAMPIHEEQTTDNVLRRVALQTLPSDIDAFRCACGYFSEYTATSLDELASIVTPKYQTLAYYGYDHDTLCDFVRRNHLCGIDRIVPLGKTTEFSLVWDGNDLINSLSRIVDIQ